MTSLSVNQLLELDRQHVWHPYSSVTPNLAPFPVRSASGVELELYDGRKLVDGMASWWSAIHGYNHPELNAAIQTQLKDMSHVMFGGLTHEPAVLLAKTLVDITPDGLNKVFICDSGSVAVEVAMKMALQYWQARQNADKCKFLSLRRGYHGDTFAAMSVCDPTTGMHHLFSETLTQQFFTDAPTCEFDAPWQEAYLDDFKIQIHTHHANIAAVILEPIVQGAGGMRIYSPQFLTRVKDLCKQYNVLLIADEIATGFGRTGKMFACEHAKITPDIMCVGKAITGGYMSLAATLCTTAVAETICNGEAGVFMHGPTFMGNPLACAVANKSIELLLASPWQARVNTIEQKFKDKLPKFMELDAVESVRWLGAIGVIELKAPVDMSSIQPKIVEQGIWLRPFGKLVYTLPPFIIKDHQLQKIIDGAFHVLKDL